MRRYRIGAVALAVCLVIVALLRARDSKNTELSLRLQPGEVRKLTLTVDTSTVVSAKEGEQRVKSRIKIPWTFRIDTVSADGAARMTVTYGQVVLGETVTKDGKTTIPFETVDGPNPLQQICDLVRDESFTIRVESDGAIRDIAGVDVIVEKLKADTVFPSLAGRRNISKHDRDKLLEGFVRQFDQPAVISLLEMFLSIYPAKPVRVGATWVRKGPGDPGRGLGEERRVTLMEHDGETATLALTARFASDAPDRVELESAQLRGTAVMDASSGWLIRMELDHDSSYLYRSVPGTKIREHTRTTVESTPGGTAM